MAELTEIQFREGDRVVYPNHGVCVVERVGESPGMPTDSGWYHLRWLANNSRIMVPVPNATRVGLRRLYDKKGVADILSRLEEPQAMSGDWKERYRENLGKMRTGRLEDIADVLQCLYLIGQRKGLSFREKKMYDHVSYLLVSEVVLVLHISESDAEKLVEWHLEQAGRRSEERRVQTA